ncbi:MAG: lamin tail domain-containing protein, partial [Planctomycetes bacterium]|nr:lamin tail domain-containing protein [Planctomycetota bacterium]
QIQFILSDGASVLGMDIVPDTWYHVTGVFDTQGNSLYAGAYGADLDIDGVMSLYVDDVLVGSQPATKTGFGDSLNRPMSINRWAGGGGDYYQGLNFNPSVYLGNPKPYVQPVSPSNGAVDVSINAEPTLEWRSGSDSNIIEHVLYFSTDESWVTNALPTDPGAIVLPVATETYQHPESLANETDYFWRVDEATGDLGNPDNVETGPVWSFTTRSVPLPPCVGLRFDGDIDGDCYVGLNDLLILAGDWLEEGISLAGDIDEDGKVNLFDYTFIGRDWLVRDNPLMISEFMAVNSHVPFVSSQNIHTTVNGKPEYSDWIEIHNPDSQNSISLNGLYLTDDAENLTKWRIPDVSIASGGYRVIWASGKTIEDHPANYPFIDDLGNLHTNFKLSQNGEYLALVDVDGVTIISEFTPEFPEQRGHISYGTGSNGIENYLVTPTPWQSNSAAFTGVVSDTKFSVDRGFFEVGETFDVAITTETADALIRYTLDGSTPTLSNGNSYTSPVHIDSITCLRAAAFKTDWLATDVDTQTYIFLDEAITQSPNGETPPGWPASSVNGQVFDYGMDPDIVNHSEYGPQMLEAMKQIPSISLVTDMANLTDPGVGIYVNATREGIMWERPVSAELINPDGTKGFQINAGLRIRGAFSRGDHNPKHSFRLLFKGGYGPGELRFPVFGNEGVDEFDNLDLRTAQNYAWSNTSSNPGHRNTFIRDVYSRDLQREMGRPYTRSRYYHLYLNGQYWGIYQSQERSEASYASSYFGGYTEFYDVIKTDNYGTSYTDGSLEKWNELWHLCDNGLETDAKYYALLGKDANGNDDPSLPVHVDIDNLIDYMTDIFFAGNQDAPITLGGTAANNFYAIRDRRSQIRQGWVFFAYDSEHSMLSTGVDRTGWFSAGQQIGHFNPQWLHQQMMVHPEYRMHFADRVHKHFFNDGAMTTSNAVALLQQRASEIDLAIIGESARWGDQRPDRVDNPYTKADWWDEVNGFLVNSFLSGRTQTVLNQLKNRDLYPNIDVPVFYINGSCQHGGHVEDNAVFSLTLSQSQTYNDKIYVDEYVSVRAHVPTDDSLGLTWTETAFTPDSSWTNGTTTTGVGYERSSGYGSWIHTDVEADMYNGSNSVFCRIEFENDGIETPQELDLYMKYDDGFIAYLNGYDVELARSNNIINATPGTATASNHDAIDTYQLFPVTDKLSRLQIGTNVLAIHGINFSPTSSDMLVLPKLVGKTPAGVITPENVWYTTNGQDPRLPGGTINPNATGYSGSFALTESIIMKVRTFDNGQWSALNEAVFAVGPVAENLRITEIMYHPTDPTQAEKNTAGDQTLTDEDFEFIELKNIGGAAINLNLVTFTDGIDFTFGDYWLGAGQFAVIVQNQAAFQARYPGVSPSLIAGTYTGSLDNDGEEIVMRDALGAEIHDFNYNDTWFTITDGMGYSLNKLDPDTASNAAPDSWDSQPGWRPSSVVNGTPGTDDTGYTLQPEDVVISEIMTHTDDLVYGD